MRVLIAEDLALLRDGLTRMLTAYGFEVVATVADGTDLADRLVEIRPDVAVVDVRLPPTFTDEGLRAALQARRRVPGLPVLILSQYVEHLYAAELLSDRSGGVGYLLKDRVGDVRDFVSAVRQVASGGTVMDPEVVARLLTAGRGRNRLSALTPREREVLAVMAEGRSNSAIAARLVITEKAVSKHINNIFAKLGLPPSDDDHRRVLAVLTYLNETT
ncbi:DNA-binding response regulator [Thermopolyspora flexuosa]|uniref:LuxR family two component transcriptional regulator n=1 Tax=Thermopolyspora flexuosa TaxID=103836 RepID=A0A543J4K7_9ACTN|nr:response regulator transcription factor [Thermopolyspora flexuosa]TQM77764.1 LuxR family two component transcriptional regulator [Thermopolyspora flexuosa]GGM70858.1 DNA-binding response regulator [Thermopolyspora flexuosa]